MCQIVGLWVSNDDDYDHFNLQLVQSACAFAVLEFFLGPFFGIIATILCICIFALYKDKTSDPTVYNVLLSMSILNTVLQIVGIAIFGSSLGTFCAYNPYYGDYIYNGGYNGGYNGDYDNNYNDGYTYYTICPYAYGQLIAGSCVWFLVLFTFGIVRTVYVFDLNNKIITYKERPRAQIVVVQGGQVPQQGGMQPTYVYTQQVVQQQQQPIPYGMPQQGSEVHYVVQQ